jgi:hypothetical protein
MKPYIRLYIIIIIIAAALSACGGAPAAETPTEPPASVTPTETPPPPTETPTPGTVFMVTTPELNQQQVQAVESVLSELASSSGLNFEIIQPPNPGEIPSHARVIFYFSPPANLGEVKSSAPETQFIVLSEQELSVDQNLSVIRSIPEQQAFLAGFISVLVGPDLRAAGLIPSDGAAGPQKLDAFLNGGRYYCGICNPVYVPSVRFPLYYTLPAGSDPAAWQEGVDQLAQNIVYIYYVAPEAASPELLNHILEINGALLGGTSPYDEIRSRWAATIQFDVAETLRQMWPQVVTGEGGQNLNAPLLVTDINPSYLTEGYMGMVNEVKQDLQNGLIYPLSIP